MKDAILLIVGYAAFAVALALCWIGVLYVYSSSMIGAILIIGLVVYIDRRNCSCS